MYYTPADNSNCLFLTSPETNFSRSLDELYHQPVIKIQRVIKENIMNPKFLEWSPMGHIATCDLVQRSILFLFSLPSLSVGITSDYSYIFTEH